MNHSLWKQLCLKILFLYELTIVTRCALVEFSLSHPLTVSFPQAHQTPPPISKNIPLPPPLTITSNQHDSMNGTNHSINQQITNGTYDSDQDVLTVISSAHRTSIKNSNNYRRLGDSYLNGHEVRRSPFDPHPKGAQRLSKPKPYIITKQNMMTTRSQTTPSTTTSTTTTMTEPPLPPPPAPILMGDEPSLAPIRSHARNPHHSPFDPLVQVKPNHNHHQHHQHQSHNQEGNLDPRTTLSSSTPTSTPSSSPSPSPTYSPGNESQVMKHLTTYALPPATGMISALALLLANSYANRNQSLPYPPPSPAFSPPSPSSPFPHSIQHIKMMEKRKTDSPVDSGATGGKLDDLQGGDLMTRESSNFGSWLKSLGSKFGKKKENDIDRVYVPPNVYKPMLPLPEGFPAPNSPDAVPLDPEQINESGILYWLNFIENAGKGGGVGGGGGGGGPQGQMHPINDAHLSSKDSQMHGNYIPFHHNRPVGIGIGEKPRYGVGPGMIQDDLILDQSENHGEEVLMPHDVDMGPTSFAASEMDMGKRYSSGGRSKNNQRQKGNRRVVIPLRNFESKPADMNLNLDPTETHGSANSPEPSASDNNDPSAPRCDKFTPTICVDDFEYPEQAIVDEIYKRRDIFEVMYSEDGLKSQGTNQVPSLVDGVSKDTEESYVYDDKSPATLEKGTAASGDSSVTGYVCPSEVLYGKPKLARDMNNEWKVIVNAGDFTQTIRMEKCLKPNGACNYIMPNLQTRCRQVYSIHRLMVFEKGRGFFVDTFKIPTGCNCQVLRATAVKPETNVNTNKGNSPNRIHPPDEISNYYNFYKTQSNPESPPHSTSKRVSPTSSSAQDNSQASPSSQPQYYSRTPILPLPSIPPSRRPEHGQHGNMNMNPGQLSNTLWSILMGTSPDGRPLSPQMQESIHSQLGLLHHLKNSYPGIGGHMNPDHVLQQLTGMNAPNKFSQMGHRFPPGTTTILNPGIPSGPTGQPLVQVIHVPVNPTHNPMFRNGPGGSMQPFMTAYESNSSATFFTGNKTSNSGLNRLSGPVNGTRGSSKDEAIPGPDEEPDEEEDEEEEDLEESGEEEPKGDKVKITQSSPQSPSPTSVMTMTPSDAIRRVNHQPFGDSLPSGEEKKTLSPQHKSPFGFKSHNQPIPPSDPVTVSGDQLNKRMLTQRINFNYHPILEYIPIPDGGYNNGAEGTDLDIINHQLPSEASALIHNGPDGQGDKKHPFQEAPPSMVPATVETTIANNTETPTTSTPSSTNFS